MPRVKRSSDGPNDGLGVIQNMQFCTDSPRHLEGFDATAAISEMFPLQDLPPSPKGDLETMHNCPLCSHVLQYDEVTTVKGDTWCYYRCPAVIDFTKCFVASAADQLEAYLDRVANTLHPCYKRGVDAYEHRKHDAMLLQQIAHSCHVQVSTKQHEALLQVSQGVLQFLSVGRRGAAGQDKEVVASGRRSQCQGQRAESQALRSGCTNQTLSSLRGHP